MKDGEYLEVSGEVLRGFPTTIRLETPVIVEYGQEAENGSWESGGGSVCSLHLLAEGGPQGGLGGPTRLDISLDLEATQTALCTDGGTREPSRPGTPHTRSSGASWSGLRRAGVWDTGLERPCS